MKATLRPLGGLLLATAALTLSSCVNRSVDGYCFNRQGEPAARYEEGQISPEVQRVTVDNRFGKVIVQVADGAPKWSWDLTCWADTRDVAEHFTEQVELLTNETADQHGFTLILPEPPVPDLRGVESNLTLSVPDSVEVEVSNSFGPTEICGLQGDTIVRSKHGAVQLERLGGRVDVENRHGDVSATEIDGNVDIQCRHGDIEVTDIGGELLLRNAHGGILARQIRGNVDVENEHGGIDLGADSADVACRNRHGDLTLCLTGTELRRVRAETTFGDLELGVLGSLRPSIETDVDFGDVESDLPVHMMDTGADNFQDPAADVPRVTLKNKHGDIRVMKVLPAEME